MCLVRNFFFLSQNQTKERIHWPDDGGCELAGFHKFRLNVFRMFDEDDDHYTYSPSSTPLILNQIDSWSLFLLLLLSITMFFLRIFFKHKKKIFNGCLNRFLSLSIRLFRSFIRSIIVDVFSQFKMNIESFGFSFKNSPFQQKKNPKQIFRFKNQSRKQN